MGWILPLISLIFALMLPRGTNVPYGTKPTVVKTLVLVNLIIHFITQIIAWQTPTAAQAIRQVLQGQDLRAIMEGAKYSPLRTYYDIFGLTPEKLQDQGWRFIQLITANFIHADWDHVILNLWLFIIFGINLEDLFGKRTFIAFIFAACLVSTMSAAGFTEGGRAYETPHFGFSGVVYAVMTAYLICFPRSKVRVILIYDFRFWLFVVGSISAICWALSFWVGTFAQLVWVLAFLYMFTSMQPEHADFGVPAFVFLGYILLRDLMTFEKQLEGGGVSVWMHAGGFMVGALAGLMLNGTKGFSQFYDDDGEHDKRLTRTEKERTETRQLQEHADQNEEAAKKFLGQRVFMGDANAAAEFYSNVVMQKFPNLLLDQRDHLTMARMLDFRGHHEPALHAYSVLLFQEPDTPGNELAFLSAANLTRHFPERIPEGIRYLNRFMTMDHILMRDRMEAKRLKQELLTLAADKGVDLGTAAEEAFEGDPNKKEDDRQEKPKNLWGAKTPVPESVPLSMRASRMKQIEPTARQVQSQAQDTPKAVPPPIPLDQPIRLPIPQPPSEEQNLIREAEAKERARRRRETAEPIKLFFQEERTPSETGEKQASGKNSSGSEQPAEAEAEPMYGTSSENAKVSRPVKRNTEEKIEIPKAREKVIDLPRRKTPSEGVTSRKPLPRSPEKPAGGPTRDDVYGFTTSLFAEKGGEGETASTPFIATRREKRIAVEQASKGYTALLSPGASGSPELLLQLLAPEFDDLEDAKKALMEGKGVLLRSLSAERARELRKRFAEAGVGVELVNQEQVALSREPVEVTGVEIVGTEAVCKAISGRFRFDLSKVQILNFCRMRLSTQSRSMRKCMEIVAAPELQRIHIWERTLNQAITTVDGRPLQGACAVDSLFVEIARRVPQEALTLAGKKALTSTDNAPGFQSLQIYDNYLTYCILLKLGERMPETEALLTTENAEKTQKNQPL